MAKQRNRKKKNLKQKDDLTFKKGQLLQAKDRGLLGVGGRETTKEEDKSGFTHKGRLKVAGQVSTEAGKHHGSSVGEGVFQT